MVSTSRTTPRSKPPKGDFSLPVRSTKPRDWALHVRKRPREREWPGSNEARALNMAGLIR
jgi:hypothetical protein